MPVRASPCAWAEHPVIDQLPYPYGHREAGPITLRMARAQRTETSDSAAAVHGPIPP